MNEPATGPSSATGPSPATGASPATDPSTGGPSPHRPLLIGLTGPIGCGKSTIGRMLAELGGEVIDADAVAREVSAPGGAVLAEIRARFGDGVFAADGALDRAALARVVFADAAALADLERITHPHVRRVIEGRLADAAADGVPIVAIEAIKLVEGGLADGCDEVWLVDCPSATQRLRLAERGMAAADIESRVAAQGPGLSDRLAAELGTRVAHRRLDTGGSLDQTREQVEEALAEALLRYR